MYAELPTEGVDESGVELDRLDPAEIARRLLTAEEEAVAAVRGCLGDIGEVCAAAVKALSRGGRIVYAGAGTSGRLGVLDAAEMGPTFGAESGRVVALLAGAPDALTEAVDGAEDDAVAGAAALEAIDPGPADLVLGISMSGTAAFVRGVLEAAARAGSTRAVLTANPAAPLRADLHIHLDLGPELLAGSTRLKGGSATKTVLNMISTAAMAGTGAVYRNLMVRVRPTNMKLRDRAERLVVRLAEVSRDEAAGLLRRASDDVSIAVLMARLDVGSAAARDRLDAAGGSLREALS
ncbi:MAG: N-acetylmuramic acid 6-phosphate etherase [Planctomycetota bacterium]